MLEEENEVYYPKRDFIEQSDVFASSQCIAEFAALEASWC